MKCGGLVKGAPAKVPGHPPKVNPHKPAGKSASVAKAHEPHVRSSTGYVKQNAGQVEARKKLLAHGQQVRAQLFGSRAPMGAPAASKIKGDTREAQALAFGLLDGTKTEMDLFKALTSSMS